MRKKRLAIIFTLVFTFISLSSTSSFAFSQNLELNGVTKESLPLEEITIVDETLSNVDLEPAVLEVANAEDMFSNQERIYGDIPNAFFGTWKHFDQTIIVKDKSNVRFENVYAGRGLGDGTYTGNMYLVESTIQEDGGYWLFILGPDINGFPATIRVKNEFNPNDMTLRIYSSIDGKYITAKFTR